MESYLLQSKAPGSANAAKPDEAREEEAAKASFASGRIESESERTYCTSRETSCASVPELETVNAFVRLCPSRTEITIGFGEAESELATSVKLLVEMSPATPLSYT